MGNLVQPDELQKPSGMSRQEAVQIRAAVEALEKLTERTETQERMLARGRAALGEANQTVAEFDSRYRGFQRGASIGLSDNIAGVVSALKGDGYREGQEKSLQKDQAAYVLDPEGFNRGQVAGSISTASLGGGSANLAKLPMWAKVGVGGLLGMGFGGAQGYGDYELDGSPDGKMWDYLKWPMTVGGGTGAAIYPLGQVAGALTRGTQNAARAGVSGYGRMPTRTLARSVQQTQDSGLDIQSYLNSLSPEATLADVPGALRMRAQGLAAVGGEGGDAVRRSVVERGEGAGQRIENDVTAYIGEPNAQFNERRRLAAERTGTLGPEYDAATAFPDPIDISGVVAAWKEAAGKAGPNTAPVLRRFIDDLKDKGGKDGVVDAATLHWIRSDLKDEIENVSSKKNVLLNGALTEIDEVLDTVPGYADARTGYANNWAMDRALDDGQDALRGGRVSALSPVELEEQFNKLSDAQKDAFRAGLRRDVAALMGTSRNDAAAAWGEFAKGWNEEKLRIILGADADPIIKRLKSERVFSETRGRVDAGAKTAETQAARDDLADYADQESGRRPGPFVRGKRALDDAGNAVVDALIYGPRRSRANADLGKMLTATGLERDRITEALLRDAMESRQPKLSPEIAKRLVRALAAGAGASQAEN